MRFLVKVDLDLMRRLDWYVGAFNYWEFDTDDEMGIL